MDAFQAIDISALEHVTGGIGLKQPVSDKVAQLRERLHAPSLPPTSRMDMMKNVAGKFGRWGMGVFFAYSFMPQSWQDAISNKIFGSSDKELPPLDK